MKKQDSLLLAFKDQEISNKVTVTGGTEGEESTKTICTQDSNGSDDYSRCDSSTPFTGPIWYDC
ncbi:hypothetical protein [Aquimarina spongiae]|uniref:Uncharacterized protein n=1 Tax=Aquimarina spongiae TaxID=570521 RepID=A0A1M6DDN2_9FLAO|nr:hypothetical protein [Aquimarina spongiae]SHI71265.1 hypothetical protein SAMN04488508_102560 [Aquimarina spongiae]